MQKYRSIYGQILLPTNLNLEYCLSSDILPFRNSCYLYTLLIIYPCYCLNLKVVCPASLMIQSNLLLLFCNIRPLGRLISGLLRCRRLSVMLMSWILSLPMSIDWIQLLEYNLEYWLHQMWEYTIHFQLIRIWVGFRLIFRTD